MQQSPDCEYYLVVSLLLLLFAPPWELGDKVAGLEDDKEGEVAWLEDKVGDWAGETVAWLEDKEGEVAWLDE